MDRAKPLGNESFERSPDDLALRVAEDALRALVEDRDALLLIDRDDGVRGDGHDAGKLGLGQTQRGLGLFALGDVFDLRDAVARRAIVAHEGPRR